MCDCRHERTHALIVTDDELLTLWAAVTFMVETADERDPMFPQALALTMRLSQKAQLIS